MRVAIGCVTAQSVTEVALGAYLLSLPLGQAAPVWLRELLLLAIIFSLAIGQWKSTPSAVPPYRLLPFAGLVALSQALSIATSSNPSLSLSASLYTPFAALIFLAAQQVMISPEAWRRLGVVFLGLIGMLGVDGTYQTLTGVSLFGDQPTFAERTRGSIPHPNDIALVPLLAPFALAAVAGRRSRIVAWVGALCLPLAAVTLIGSSSRTAWLGTAVAVAVWGLLAGRRRIGVTVLVSLAASFGLALVLDVVGIRERLLNPEIGGRLGLWRVAWQMFTEAPLLGQGVHVFDDFYPSYLDRVSLPEGYTPETGYVPWAHNIYLELLAERGLLGFASFAALVGAMLGRVVSAARRGGREHRLYTAALGASVGSFLAMGMLDLTFLKDWVLLLFWLLAALCARISLCFEPADVATRER